MKNLLIMAFLAMSSSALAQVNVQPMQVPGQAAAPGQAVAEPPAQLAPVTQPYVAPAPVKRKITAAPAPSLLDVRSGINQRIGIALSHTNRLLMPFKKPVVKTNSTATISVEGNIVYVSTSSEEPITLFIHEVGEGDPAVSLTLVPNDIAPISSQIRIIGYEPNNRKNEMAGDAPISKEQAESFETALPYVQTLTAIMKDLALEKVPEGYGLTNVRGYSNGVPRCNMPGIVLEPFQLLMGSELKVFVYRATNTSTGRVEVQEDKCGVVRAVAAWPRRTLDPGQSTEIYIITSRGENMDPSAVRKSVVGN